MASPEPCLKRKRSAAGPPLTPPLTAEDSASGSYNRGTLSRAVHVLSTEAAALSHITMLYQTDPIARRGLVRAVDAVAAAHEAGGKLVVCGVGKSGLVGRKTVATMKSLGLGASFMHAGEALHGDLGDVRRNDAVLLITFSGKTPELLALLPHLPAHSPVLVLTAHTAEQTCRLFDDRPDAILLPAPIHEAEEKSFGVSAPTTSTTVAIALGDMLAITAAEAVHRCEERARTVFHRNHPGGAIGEKVRREEKEEEEGAKDERDLHGEDRASELVQVREWEREHETPRKREKIER